MNKATDLIYLSSTIIPYQIIVVMSGINIAFNNFLVISEARNGQL